MSLDRSLKTGGSLIQHRTVLTRAERIAKLAQGGEDVDSPLGLRKVTNPRPVTGKKTKKKGPGDDDAEA